MPGFHVIVENEKGHQLDVDMVDSFQELRPFMEKSFGDIFKVYEDTPFIWKAGECLHCTKRPNGSIDMVRVPIED